MEHKKIDKEVETFLEFNQDAMKKALFRCYWSWFNGRIIHGNLTFLDKNGNKVQVDKIRAEVKTMKPSKEK